MEDIVIVAAKRTAVGNFGGSLASLSAAELGATVIKELLNSTQLDPGQVDEVIFGQVLQAGCGQNSARIAAMQAGLPQTTPAMTINKVCGSSMKALHLAAQAIKNGDANVIIAGGHESMSQSPHLLTNSRNGQRMGDWPMVDSMLRDGLTCALNDFMHMGVTAENVAQKYQISRDDQDNFALNSQQKATQAQVQGRFADEIVPVDIVLKRRETIRFMNDEFIKRESSLEKIRKPRPAFQKDGSVTAANASGINDGAAALLVMSRATADKLKLKPLVRVSSFRFGWGRPENNGHRSSSCQQESLGRRRIGASTNSISSNPTRPSPLKPSRLIRKWVGIPTMSTSTVAPSPSATPSVPAVRASLLL